MNDALQQFARQTIKFGLAKLPTEYQRTFKLMYVPWIIKNPKRLSRIYVTNEECEAMPINQVVDQMPDDKLDWAMQQVENSLRKIEKATPIEDFAKKNLSENNLKPHGD